MAKRIVFDKYRVEITRQPDGSYLAVCPDVSGVYAEGKTYLDAMLNLEDVLRISLDLLGQKPVPSLPRKFSLEIPNPLRLGLTA